MIFVQDEYSAAEKDVLRPLPYWMDQTQGKFVRVFHGVVFDAVVDLRQ